jgi:hypothetical protein
MEEIDQSLTGISLWVKFVFSVWFLILFFLFMIWITKLLFQAVFG